VVNSLIQICLWVSIIDQFLLSSKYSMNNSFDKFAIGSLLCNEKQ